MEGQALSPGRQTRSPDPVLQRAQVPGSRAAAAQRAGGQGHLELRCLLAGCREADQPAGHAAQADRLRALHRLLVLDRPGRRQALQRRLHRGLHGPAAELRAGPVPCRPAGQAQRRRQAGRPRDAQELAGLRRRLRRHVHQRSVADGAHLRPALRSVGHRAAAAPARRPAADERRRRGRLEGQQGTRSRLPVGGLHGGERGAADLVRAGHRPPRPAQHPVRLRRRQVVQGSQDGPSEQQALAGHRAQVREDAPADQRSERRLQRGMEGRGGRQDQRKGGIHRGQPPGSPLPQTGLSRLTACSSSTADLARHSRSAVSGQPPQPRAPRESTPRSGGHRTLWTGCKNRGRREGERGMSAMERKPRYRVAIIGTGRMGGLIEDEIGEGSFSKPYGHFSAYQAIEQTEVVAVANRGAERLERFKQRFGVTNTYLDYREMIDKERPDIVSVTTPSFVRAEPIIYSAEHGVRGIYAEKGLSASLEEADQIAAALKANNVAFNWGAMRRHHSGYVQLREAISVGEIGTPRYATMYFFTDLITHHPHTLDTVSMLLGDPVPEWVEGRLVEPGAGKPHGGEGDDAGVRRTRDVGDREAQAMRRPLPAYDREKKRFVPPEGEVYASPYPGFFRVGYRGG